MISSILYKRVDNSALIVFRVLFGIIVATELSSRLISGWVRRIFIEPEFTFNFIGFDFLQPLPGIWMNVYFILMILLCLFIAIGFKYRWSTFLCLLMWLGIYFMQKTAYSNYHYLIILTLFILALSPANKYKSVDVWLNPSLKTNSMPQWVKLLFIAQIGIMYTYAAIAKLYPDWLDGRVPGIILEYASNGQNGLDLFQNKIAILFIGFMGILFDFLIVPLLLWKRTRWVAFSASIVFHFFNSYFFNVATFPFLSLSFAVFFFSEELIRKKFLPHKERLIDTELNIPKKHKFITGFFVFYLVLQLVLPIRHWFIKGDVTWTEEGHRLSWRLMLRFRDAETTFKVYKKATNDTVYINNADYLTKYQISFLSKPDAIWQFSQHLKNEFNEKGEDISIFVDSKVRLNHKKALAFIDPDFDMAKAEWDYFFHNEWILLYE
jgi:uncharacterized membrane protein YphA (DoxX/SURF4 family)